MPSHSSQDWSRALALLDEALDLSPSQRPAWQAGLGAESAGAQAALVQMLAQRGQLQVDAFLSGQALHDIAPLTDAGMAELAPSHLADQLLGPWRLLRLLGRGGMAQVWLAERADGAHQRQVALKLPHAHADAITSAPQALVIVQRFLRERAILSSLRHPHIAQVLDAGSDQLQPWLAMEFVDGAPITEFAQAQGLDTPARLRLFLQVMEAVAHAHARLVLHRDIKPANVLVDQQGQVKLLDFGVAKLLQTEGSDGTADTAALTQVGGRAMTPQYASPEQIAGEPLGTASDVYSLGVLLYELLTGRLPYVTKRGTAAAMEEAILEGQRLLPSQAATLPGVARQLRGDIDTIAMKALQPEPGKRYASAQALAQDIERFLNHEPITARPDNWAYRLQKLWRRQKLALSAALAVVLALVVGLGAALWQVQQKRQLLAQATASQQASQAVQLLLETSMNAASENGKPRGIVAGLAHIEDTARRMYGDYPEVQAEVLMLLGHEYGSLQQPKERARLMNEALLAARKSAVAPLVAAAQCRTVDPYANGAVLRLQAAVNQLRLGAEFSDVRFARARFDCQGMLATLLAWDGKAEEAEEAARLAERELAVLGPLAVLLKPDLFETRADVARSSGQLDRAESYYSQALGALHSSGRARTLKAAVLLNYRMRMLLSLGRPDQALAVSDELQAFFEGMGSSSSMPAYMISNRSAALLALGQLPAAQATARLAVQRALDTQSVVYESGARARVVEALIAQGDGARAAHEMALRDDALQKLGKPEADGRTELLRARLAWLSSDTVQALRWLAQAEQRASSNAFERPTLAQALLLRTRVQLAQGDKPAAARTAQSALALCQSMGPLPSLQINEAQALLAQAQT
jgi:eukaryotic-like serine/threonine-protein kinase